MATRVKGSLFCEWFAEWLITINRKTYQGSR